MDCFFSHTHTHTHMHARTHALTQSKIGGGGGTEGIYGSLRDSDLSIIFDFLLRHHDAKRVDLTVLVDVGCGLCR